MEIASRHNLEVFEDSAQAAGAKINGRGAGTFGRWGVYSFYPSKTLGCFGDAGALVTNDDDIANKVRRMRNHGAGPDKIIGIDIDIWGTNSRIDNIQAGILSYKLTYYDQAIARRREIAALYHNAFSRINALRLPPRPDVGPYFDIFQNYELCTGQRDALRHHLAGNGIGTIVQWGGFGIHQLKGLGFTADLPKTDRFFQESLLLPMNHILTDEQVSHVIRSVGGFFGGRE
jgi:dTDP-4-amino-4,6-dideoxygalactose transaminase